MSKPSSIALLVWRLVVRGQCQHEAPGGREVSARQWWCSGDFIGAWRLAVRDTRQAVWS